jgi:hypothetical protein
MKYKRRNITSVENDAETSRERRNLPTKKKKEQKTKKQKFVTNSIGPEEQSSLLMNYCQERAIT